MGAANTMAVMDADSLLASGYLPIGTENGQ